MAYNKILLGDQVLIDLTGDTVAADKLLEGYTAHDASGVEIVGTAVGGIDTSDADASAENIEIGKTAYVNGNKIVGTLPNSGGSFFWQDPYLENGMIKMDGEVGAKRIFDVDSVLKASVPADKFGDAGASDVSQGKTFTSVSGVKIVGTAVGGDSSGGLPLRIIAGDTPVLANWTAKKITATSITDSGASITISKAGIYRFKIPACAYSGYTSGSSYVYLYKNGVQLQSAEVTNAEVKEVAFDLECDQGDVISVYGEAVKSGYFTTYVTIMGLVACIDWDNGL